MGASTFIGFPEGTYERVRSSYELLRGGLPQLSVHHDVIAFPDYDSLYDRKGDRIEGLCGTVIPADLAGQAIVDSYNRKLHMVRPLKTEIPEDAVIVDRPVVLAGAFIAHYGHFVTDGMSRLWALDLIADDVPLFFHRRLNRAGELPPYIRRAIELMGLAGREIVTADAPTTFRNLIVPESAFQWHYRAFDCVDAPHLRIAAAADATPPPADRVFLSRGALDSKARRYPQEAALEERMRAAGYAIVHPEQLPLDEQIAIFNRAEWIVGLIGSAFHSSLFSRPEYRGKLAMLSWNEVNNRFPMTDAIKHFDAYYLNCITLNPAAGGALAGDLDLDIAIRQLGEIGAL